MKNLIKISAILLMALCLAACRKESDRLHDYSFDDALSFGAAKDSFGEKFKVLWEGLNSNYALWDYEAEQGLDWDEVYETYYPKFVELDTLAKQRQITDEEFTALLKAVVAALHDGHICIDMQNHSTGSTIRVFPGGIHSTAFLNQDYYAKESSQQIQTWVKAFLGL